MAGALLGLVLRGSGYHLKAAWDVQPFVTCDVQPPHKRQPWEMARITPSPPPSPVPTGPKVQFGATRAMLEDFVRAGNTQLAMLRALDR